VQEIALLIPEIILVALLALLIVAELTYHGERVRLITATTLIGLVSAMLYTILSYTFAPARVFGGVLSVDGLSLFFKLFFLALAAISVTIATRTQDIPREKRAEYFSLIVAGTLALSFASAASDLLVCFLSLQTFNLVTYLIAAYGKSSVASTEASVKQLSFGVLAGAMMLFGGAMLFAIAKTIDIYQMGAALSSAGDLSVSLLVLLILLLLAFSFHLYAFPMAIVAPDVLQGAPTPASAFIALGGRAMGFAVALRFLVVVFSKPGTTPGQWEWLGSGDWPRILAVISGATLLYGAFLATRQLTVKRLLACLIVTQTGFLLMGLLVGDELGVAASLYNLLIELFAVAGAFYVVSFLDRKRGESAIVHSFPETICLILFLVCLAGIPPLPGFIGKFALLGTAVSHEWYSLTALALLASALSAVAVFRLSYGLIGGVKEGRPVEVGIAPSRIAILSAFLVPLLFLGAFAEQAMHWAARSLRFILW
jgi:proton-translocating NADH-quinone oxidoreductase chain N